MAAKQELEISISKAGDVKIEVVGAKGKKCFDATEELEKLLGDTVDVELKAEFYENENQESEINVEKTSRN